MAGWRCFLITQTDYVRRELRRFCFSSSGACSAGPMGGHDATVIIDDQVLQVKADPLDCESAPPIAEFEQDSRWPTHCAQCGQPFPAVRSMEGGGDGSFLQVNAPRLYSGFPDGRLRSLGDRDLPPGMMYEVWWLRGNKGCTGADGKCWAVQMPSGQPWFIDNESSSGGHWTRTGEPPMLTCSPSINHPGHYHGWLQGGILTADCEGRTFPQWPFTA